MRPRILLIVASLLLCPLAALAQGILPGSFGGWIGTPHPSLPPLVFHDGEHVVTLNASQEAAVRQEYGFIAVESGDYARGADAMRVSLYRMKDPSGAYGLYSCLRTPDMARAALADHSFASGNNILVLLGNLILDVHGDNLQKHTADLKALIAAVSPRAGSGALPTLWQHLPVSHLVEGTDRYVLGPQTLNQFFPVPLGDSLGFSRGAEAELARYHLAGHDATMLLADFPTPQIAIESLDELQKKFNVNNSSPGANTPALYAKRSLTLLAIVSGAPTEADADALLSQVESGTILTWNEPSFSLTQPSIETMVVGAIIGTGILCAFTLVASLAFGGFRLFVKRALPGKVFDRAEQVQVLQLGISSKPIKSDDFYDRSGPLVERVKLDKKLPDRIALRIFR